MSSSFSNNITQFVISELDLAAQAKDSGNITAEFQCLENVHVLGQESTYWHVKVHMLMFMWACRNFKPKELLGQALRIFGAATKTAFGLVPQGNTGGANVSPFKNMPIKPEYEAIINSAKSGV
jgi:hypothetical protein